MSADPAVLCGQRIVVTRPEHQADEMLAALRKLGADVVPIPTIRIQAKADLSALDAALLKIDRYRWVVFTSANGVRITVDRHRELGLELERLGKRRIAAIGPATADTLQERGVPAEFIPESFVAEEVAAGLPDVEGGKVLLPRADGARPVLPQRLEARGATVDEIPIYQSVRAEVTPQDVAQLKAGVDAITFTSPSTAQNFTRSARLAGLDPLNLPGEPLIACIGPITAEAAAGLGYRVDVVAEEFTAEGLVEALRLHYAKEVHGGRR